MKDLRCVDVHFYYKILNSDFFNKADGYVKMKIDNATKNFNTISSAENFYKKSREVAVEFAKEFDVSVDDVISISYEEYTANTDEE